MSCYNYRKVGHIRPNCPQNKNDEKSKKKRRDGKEAMCAAWDEESVSSENESSGKEGDDLCFMGLAEVTNGISISEVCLKGKPTKDKWFLDSSCSRHMTRGVTKFAFITMSDKENVTFGDDTRSKIIGEGTIKIKDIKVEHVLLVDGLLFNSISISQLCDLGHKVLFENDKCKIINAKNNEVEFVAYRDGNMYSLALEDLKNQNILSFRHKRYLLAMA
ncbi:uncharacterized protein LOC143878881 [Tasmannia lanceolata]|uniref:uncharacterized protein LOC143878881 n=1 Tax=Tasmannia lanceolata TaxID=3420 RepID=UPI004062E814